MTWILETFEHSPAVPVLIVALLCMSFYLLGEQNASRYYWWKPLDSPPEELEQQATPSRPEPEEVAYLEPDTVTIETVIVPTPADFEDTLHSLEERTLAAEAEAARQARLKEQHIKEKAKLKEAAKPRPLIKVRRK